MLRLLDTANRSDPYPIYDEIRSHGPLRLPEMNLVVFSMFVDCDEVLRHPASASDRSKSTVARRQIQSADERTEPPSFLVLDRPDHTRLRRLVSKAFAPKVVSALQPDITALVDSLLDGAGSRFDVVDGLPTRCRSR